MRLVNNRIAVAPGGQSGSWGDFDKAFETPVEDPLTIIPKDIDPQGLFKALLGLFLLVRGLTYPCRKRAALVSFRCL